MLLEDRQRRGDGGVAKALPQLSGLQYLNLCDNGLGAALEALAKALPQLSGLQHLNLCDNGLGAAGMEALAKAGSSAASST